jgi:hypothetical protein
MHPDYFKASKNTLRAPKGLNSVKILIKAKHINRLKIHRIIKYLF